MKNVDEFVKKDWAWPKTLSGQIKNYNKLKNKIECCLSRKEEYDRLINEERTPEESDKLSFKDKWGIYSIIDIKFYIPLNC